MKKRIAILSACVLLVSLFSFAMMPVGATEIAGASDFFFDFSKGATIYDEYTEGATEFYNATTDNGVLAHDAKVGALKVSTKAEYTANSAIGTVRFFPSADVSVSTATYPIFAVKIKMIKTDLLPTRNGNIRNADTEKFVGVSIAEGYKHGVLSSSTPYAYEANNGDWQLMVFDATSLAETIPTWTGAGFSLVDTQYNQDTTLYDGVAEDLAYVAWAGAFESAAAAQTYFDETTEAAKTPEIAQDPSGRFWNFSLGTSAPYYQDAYRFGANGNATVAFDPAENAIKISTKDSTTTTGIGAVKLQNNGLSVYADLTKYPIYAIKIKVARNDLGYMTWSGAANATGDGTYRTTNANVLQYADTTEWQLLTVNLMDSTNFTGGFGNKHVGHCRIDSLTTNADILSEGENVDLAWIQWAGCFASVADAEMFFGETSDPDKVEIPEEETTPEALPTPEGASAFFMDFTQGITTGTSKWRGQSTPYLYVDGNAAVAYDETARALKISTKEGSTADTIGKVEYFAGTNLRNTISGQDYPIWAMKVKMIKTDMQPAKNVYAYKISDNKAMSIPTVGNSIYTSYTGQGYSYEYGNGEWQLITATVADATAITNWDGAYYQLASSVANNPELTDSIAEDLAYVQWAGAFASVEAAEAYFTQTTEDYTAINKSTLFFYGGLPFSSHYYCVNSSNFMGAVANTNSAAEYDATEHAYKISTVAGNDSTADLGAFHAQHDGSWNGKTDKLSEYPYFAMAVNTIGTNLGAPTVKVATNGRNAGWQTVSLGNYAETTEWQLLVGAAPKGSDSYNGFRIYNFTNNADIIGDGSAAVDLGWIKWGGLFKTEADAQAYFALTFPELVVEEEPALAGSGAAIRKALYNGAQGLRFYQTLKTTQTETADGIKETVKYEGEDVVVKDVFVIMSTETTLQNVGEGAELTKELVEENAKVQQTAITSCRSRVQDEEGNVTYEFTALLSNVKSQNKSILVCARAYLVCENAAGEEVYVYGDTQVTSVLEMYTALGGTENAEFLPSVHTWMTAA